MQKGYIIITPEVKAMPEMNGILDKVFTKGYNESQEGLYYKISGESPLMDILKEGETIPQYHFRVKEIEGELTITEFRRAE
jgi:hypothetical protein